MTSPGMMNDDVVLDIISRCPMTDIAKFRILNNVCNKRTYEFCFIKDHLQRTNSVLGYFIQRSMYHCLRFVSGVEEEAPEKPRITLEFLPFRLESVFVGACDTHHGILLCVVDGFKGGCRIPDYIVSKPATKQYRIIPNPKTRYRTVAIGLMVVQLKQFRYKIVRISERTRERLKMNKDSYNYNCEVFDSDTFVWKQLNDLELPTGDFFLSLKPVSSYGFLHWLTYEKNVIRFCMRTETWSFCPVPTDVARLSRCSLDLVSYEGKLGVIYWEPGEEYSLWILDKSLEQSWMNVKNVKYREYGRPLWFLSNDVASMGGSYRLSLFNMNCNKLQYLPEKTQDNLPFYFYKDKCFPFYSNFENVSLNKNRVEDQRQKKI